MIVDLFLTERNRREDPSKADSSLHSELLVLIKPPLSSALTPKLLPASRCTMQVKRLRSKETS